MKYAVFIFLISTWALNAEVLISDNISVDGYAITSDKSPKKNETKPTKLTPRPSAPSVEIRLLPSPDEADFSNSKVPLIFEAIDSIYLVAPFGNRATCG
jgi:hypothetical protein